VAAAALRGVRSVLMMLPCYVTLPCCATLPCCMMLPPSAPRQVSRRARLLLRVAVFLAGMVRVAAHCSSACHTRDTLALLIRLPHP
jgi:hypothetical protein